MTPKLAKDNIKEIAFSFESFHGILYNFGTINGSHIPIIATKIDPRSYYCPKKTYFTLIEGIINGKCIF